MHNSPKLFKPCHLFLAFWPVRGCKYDRHFEEVYLHRSFFVCTKFSVASVHLHQSYHVKRIVTTLATGPCALAFSFQF